MLQCLSMFNNITILILATIFIQQINIVHLEQQPANSEINLNECTCSFEGKGEYCGTMINKLTNKTACPKKMFFCGNSNQNKPAILLIDCADGFECDKKTFCS